MRYTTGAATNSKNPDRYAVGAPETVDWAQGAWVCTDDGRRWAGTSSRWVDLTSGLGAVILGHNYEAVLLAAAWQLARGSAYPVPSPLEEEVARQLCDFIPWAGAEQVRWSKNGRDAVVAAVRLARAVTGRSTVLYCDYHGSDDLFLAYPPWNAGVYGGSSVKLTREEVRTESLRDAACLVIEPVSSNAPEEPHDFEFWDAVREQCDRYGVMLIVDEMVSFGRAPTGTASGWLDIRPDLWVGGKCLANGLPLTAIVGPEKYMRRYAVDVFHSMTHAGEVVALAAAGATLRALHKLKPWMAISALGSRIITMFEERGRSVRYAYPTRLLFDFTKDELGVLLEHGVLCAGYANLTLAHVEDREATETILRAFRVALGPARNEVPSR